MEPGGGAIGAGAERQIARAELRVVTTRHDGEHSAHAGLDCRRAGRTELVSG
jgi:hypothetical protein